MTNIIRGIYNLKPAHQGCVITIGNFDGVHLGHQALFAKMIQKAKEKQTASLVMTFEPLTKEYFGRDKKVPRLTRWREKFHAISQSGIDHVFLMHFNQQIAALSADDFIKDILVKKLAIKHIIVGDDFHFGKGREGNFVSLKKAGEQYGFTVEAIPSLFVDDIRVSSTSVREALANADHSLAEKLLGRPYTMQGKVVHGDKLGRRIGFPTANIYLHRAVSPVLGVYIVRMRGVGDQALPGVANVGIRPTIGGTRALLEVHLFNFNQNIYGKHISVEFIKKIRDEEHFANLDLLTEKIAQDAEIAREYFKI